MAKSTVLPKAFYENVGRNIRALREALNISQREFSDIVKPGANDYTVFSAYEMGTSPMSLQRLVELANGLGVPVSRLLVEPDEPKGLDYEMGYRQGYVHAMGLLRDNIPQHPTQERET